MGVIAFLVAMALIAIFKKLQEAFVILKQDLINLGLIIYQYKTYIILSIIVAVLGTYNLYQVIAKKRQTKREFRAKLREEKDYVDKFLYFDLYQFNYDELKNKIKEMEGKEFLQTYPELKQGIKEAKKILVELKHRDEVLRLINEKQGIKEEIEELLIEKEKIKKSEKQRILEIKNNLELDENYVFEKSKLNEEEIEIILEESYKQVNQYCVQQQKVITAFVKPPMRHSITHAFLVWSVRNLLEEYGVIENIKEHETRDADITFEIDGEIFAIEIETGTILSKKDQLSNKARYLRRKYKKNWFIVVSHRSLIQKYKKFGECTQRNGVREKLEKMAKI